MLIYLGLTPLPAALICPPRSLRQPNPLLLFRPSPRIQPTGSPFSHNFSGAISRRSKALSTRCCVACGLQDRFFKRHYATSKLWILFGKKSKLSHLPARWHRMMVGYPKVRSASTMTLSAESSSSDSLLATELVRVNPIAYDADTSFSMEPGFDADKLLAYKLKTDNTSLPPLPSPHLCPRRTFLTSLIS